MTTTGSGSISLSQVAAELHDGSPISLGQSDVRQLGGDNGGGIVRLGDMYNRTSPGTLLSTYCSGPDLWGTYANGGYPNYASIVVASSSSCSFPNSVSGITCPGSGSQGTSISYYPSVVAPQDYNYVMSNLNGSGLRFVNGTMDGETNSVVVMPNVASVQPYFVGDGGGEIQASPNNPNFWAPISRYLFGGNQTTVYQMNRGVAFVHPNTNITAAQANAWGYDAVDVRRAQNITVLGFTCWCNENVTLGWGLLTNGQPCNTVSNLTTMMVAADNPIPDQNYHGYGTRAQGYGMSNINPGPFSPMNQNQMMIGMMGDDYSGYGMFAGMELDLAWTDYGPL